MNRSDPTLLINILAPKADMITQATSTVLDDSITRKSDGYTSEIVSGGKYTAGSCAWDDAAERAIALLRAKGYTAEDVIAAMRARP